MYPNPCSRESIQYCLEFSPDWFGSLTDSAVKTCFTLARIIAVGAPETEYTPSVFGDKAKVSVFMSPSFVSLFFTLSSALLAFLASWSLHCDGVRHADVLLIPNGAGVGRRDDLGGGVRIPGDSSNPKTSGIVASSCLLLLLVLYFS